MVKTVIFDFDGTLADSFESIILVFEKLVGRKVALNKDEVKQLRGLPLREVAKRLHVPIWKVPYLLLRGRRILGNRIDSVKLYSGIKEVIQELHAQNYEMFIVSSNNSQNIRRFLQNNDLEKYFTGIYAGASLFNKAKIINKLINKSKLDLGTCVYIGDETRDIEAAQALGLKSVAVKWGFADPEFLARLKPAALADKPSDIIKILKTL